VIGVPYPRWGLRYPRAGNCGRDSRATLRLIGSEAEVLELARQTALPTHGHSPRGIVAAQAVALANLDCGAGGEGGRRSRPRHGNGTGTGYLNWWFDANHPTSIRLASMNSQWPDPRGEHLTDLHRDKVEASAPANLSRDPS
jgi:hypothetical protein